MALTLFLTLFLFTRVTAASVDDCPEQLQRSQYLRAFGDSCYEFVVNYQREWPTAEQECEVRGGHLVIIRDNATNQFLYNTLKEVERYHGMIFIGLTDRQVEGQWVWVDGSPATYTNWAPDQPGFAGGFENCAAMDSHDGKWHDYYCQDFLFKQNDNKFICQYPAVERNTTTTETPMTSETPRGTDGSTTELDTTAEMMTATTTDDNTTLSAECPPFVCSLDCGLDGYQLTDQGCALCVCAT